MIPQTVESWVFLGVACVAGFMIGRWIHNRRNKTTTDNAPYDHIGSTHQRKRVSKKERRKGHRPSK
jgi:hypothetical protein